MKTMPEQISAARRAKGYTQEQFAEQLHVSRQAVSHWETGRATPDLNTLQEIARLLDQPALLVPPEAEPQEDSPAPRVNWRAVTASAAVLIVLLIALVFVLHALREKPRAEIIIQPETPVAYLLRDSDILWDVMFTFENVTDVPFRPECLIASYYANEQLGESLVLMHEDLLPYMGGEAIRREYQPLLMPFGSSRPFYTRIVCHLYGTDENGHLLHFEGSCELVYEYAPDEP